MKNFIVILLLSLVSCQKENQNKITNPYLGSWYFDGLANKDTSITNSHIQTYGDYYNFSILNDSIIDYKSGFSHFINFDAQYYLGTETKYRIKNSFIEYFNKSENVWDTIQIKKMVGDTMIIVGYEKALFRLIRKHDTYFNNDQFDAIIVDRSPCYGSCPFNSTYLDRKGNFYFKGYKYNTQGGNFFSKLDQETIKKFFTDFDKIDISKLQDYYSYGATDSQTNEISFVKNGKIIKTISTYIKCPSDLNKAFEKLSYAYQQVKLNYDYNNEFIFNNKVVFGRFKTKKIDYSLKDSESFFLENEIRKGTKTQDKFTEKYELSFYEYSFKEGDETEIKRILSDGRYFKFIKKDRTFFVIDIGYNFIDRNPLIKKNRDH